MTGRSVPGAPRPFVHRDVAWLQGAGDKQADGSSRLGPVPGKIPLRLAPMAHRLALQR